MESPSFRVYARKPSIGHETLQPNKPKQSQKKRKKREVKEVEINNSLVDDFEIENLNKDEILNNIESEIKKKEESRTIIENITNDGNDSPTKRAKHTKSYEEFQQKLDKLFDLKQNLNTNDQIQANEASLERLLSLEPNYTIDYFLKPPSQNQIINNNNSNSTIINDNTNLNNNTI